MVVAGLVKSKWRPKSFENKIFPKKVKLHIRKSPWPGRGGFAPPLAKVQSAPEVGQPMLDYLNRPFQKFRKAGQGLKSMAH